MEKRNWKKGQERTNEVGKIEQERENREKRK